LVNGMLPVVQLDRVVTTAAQEIKRNATSSIVQSKQAIAAICSQGRVEEDQELVVASYLSEDFKDRVSKALARNSST